MVLYVAIQAFQEWVFPMIFVYQQLGDDAAQRLLARLGAGSLTVFCVFAVRVMLRVCDLFLGVSAFDAVSGALSFLLVPVINVPLAISLLRPARPQREG